MQSAHAPVTPRRLLLFSLINQSTRHTRSLRLVSERDYRARCRLASVLLASALRVRGVASGDGDGGRRGNEKSHTERSTYTRTVHDTRSLLSERVDGDTEQMAATKCNHTERSTVRIRGERPDREN